jgi:hypothetical protein
MQQHAMMEFLTAENMLLNDIYQHLKVVYGEECVDICTIEIRGTMAATTSKVLWLVHLP